MRTSPHGNSEGFFLLDAIVSLFIATIAVIVVMACISSALKTAAILRQHAASIIESRNLTAQRTFQIDETK